MINQKRLKKINRLSKKYKAMSDKKLKEQVSLIKDKLSQDITKEQGLIEGFALVREADARVLKLYPTNEQVLGALTLYEGNIVEMKTGEGKSLVATMPLFLKGLTSAPAFLVTTNDYLARRDFERIGKVYIWLGLKVSDGSNDESEKEFNIERKKQIYDADIVYISNGTLGFDFLINGLAESQEKQFIPSLNYALLDEVDEILLDSAQNPLVISGGPKVQSNYYKICNHFIITLNKKEDYMLDEENQNVWLTPKGIEKAKHYFSLPNLLSPELFSLYQHIVLALKAHYIMIKEKDYLVEGGKVKLLDKKDGRILESTNLQSGLHQAIQAKEEVEITSESQTISSITFQNLFRKFKELSGMSGTAKVAENEFISTYNLSVKKIKTKKKNIRKDHKPEQYVTFEQKFKAILNKIQILHDFGRPVLVIAGSVAASELISLELYRLGISHNVLNAKSSSKEAKIIKEAGEVGTVTISTAMAGRGTDISISEDSKKIGGLAVIITERMMNRRVELQAKGRAGRQGEPGDTFIFESLEDEIIQLYVHDKVQNYYDKHKDSLNKIKNPKIKKVFKQAQELTEDRYYFNRMRALQFDDVLSIQKKSIDETRKRVLEFSKITEMLDFISPLCEKVILTKFPDNKEVEGVKRFILDYVDYNFKGSFLDNFSNPRQIRNFIKEIWEENLNHKRETIKNDQVFMSYLRITVLKAIDEVWSQQVDLLNQLRLVVSTRTIAQKKVAQEFEREAQDYFQRSQSKVLELILKNTALSLLEFREQELIVTFP